MDKKFTKDQNDIQRERLVSFIVQAVNRLGMRELDLVVRFIKNITE